MQEYLRVSEVAQLLGVRAETVRVWFDQGKVRGIRLPGNGERRVARRDIEAILEDRR